jgi:anti-sigma regulatory factor (Ser/Thr protein kinase)
VISNEPSPPTPLVVTELLPLPGASRHARNVVTQTCATWDLSHLVASASLIVTELVGNVIDHAHTMMRLEVSRETSYLHIRLYDGSAAPPIRPEPATTLNPGRGLLLVAASSTAWGYTSEEGGKVVWACLPVSAS